MLSRRSFSKILSGAPFVARAQQPLGRARIKIDTERVISDIDPMIYGNFIEHLGRCIDGGVFQEGSPFGCERLNSLFEGWYSVYWQVSCRPPAVHAFRKKSTQGIKTPKREVDLIKDHLKRLKE